MAERRRLLVEGCVQGVGFRPFVYGLAARLGLAGHVYNHVDGVTIEVEGDPGRLDAFVAALHAEKPPLAAIERLTAERLAPLGSAAFTILESRVEARRNALIVPDAATCDDCLRELFDPNDRRYRYPFINCTNCGPRFTIVKSVPYDRERTSMDVFEMCPACRSEYHDPADRRFHAQPNACSACGPRVRLLDAAGAEVAAADPAAAAAALIREGAIVAVKGLGGYHLACDAADEGAVAALRGRKHREDKPFAVMASLEALRAACEIDASEEALLLSPARPIVLLRSKDGAAVATSVAPGQKCLGAMLAYTPLHHLLLAAGGILVMTSGNVSEEPIAYDDAEALRRLAGIADHFLVHDRAIVTRCDDSVTRVFEGREAPVRRSRGYTPSPISLHTPFALPVLAVGAHLKNTFCLGKNGHAFVSHHIGDLENYEALRSFEEGIEHFKRMFDVEPALVAHDLHPEYLSTRYAAALDDVQGAGVQHHHAHIASCMAEHGLEGPVLGVAFDGTGLGDDGTIWGAEFLLTGYTGYERLAHLEYVMLPGGEAAVRQPWRVAAAWLDALYGEASLSLPIGFNRRIPQDARRRLRALMASGTNCPPASSMGRLFDAVSSLLGVRDVSNYEGQAAIELEMIAAEHEAGRYPLPLRDGLPIVLEARHLIAAVIDDLKRGEAPAVIAARFHNTVAASVAETCRRLRQQTGVDTVVLGGGVFQNVFLLQRTCAALRDEAVDVFWPVRLPANDGGICLGQAVIASERSKHGIGAATADHDLARSGG